MSTISATWITPPWSGIAHRTTWRSPVTAAVAGLQAAPEGSGYAEQSIRRWHLFGLDEVLQRLEADAAGLDLEGRAFLHSYDWRQDAGFKVLELILTAPVVVASWISLQYYGSTVAPDCFGGGNKLIHNVVGGLGVVEGNGGRLRPGLPWQSVHDGNDFHDSGCDQAHSQ